MARILRSPGKYVQGAGVLAEAGTHLAELGDRAFLLTSPGGRARVATAIEPSLGAAGLFSHYESLAGECSQSEVERLQARLAASGCNVVVGLGGGKVLDTAKAIAYFTGLPLAVIPTVASSDAPCSALSVLYTEAGEFDRYLFMKQSPQLVLVDTALIAKAPARLLVAGMGDALATWFEARAVSHSGKNNQVAGKPGLAAQALAARCHAVLMADGRAALQAAQRQCCTPALENIVEANTYLSGVGFESGGLGAAHALQKGFTTLRALDDAYHGEKVAFGVLVQLVLENAPKAELAEVLAFCRDVGLPLTLARLGAPALTTQQLQYAAEFAAKPGMTIHNMPFETSPGAVRDAILAADALGAEYGQSPPCRIDA